MKSRKKYKKLTDPEIMKTITEDMDIYSIPFVKSLKIDTSVLSSDKAAAAIVENLWIKFKTAKLSQT